MKKLLITILSLSLLGTAALPALAVGSEPSMAISHGTDVITTAQEVASTTQQEESLTAQGFSVEIDGSSTDARACIMVPLRAIAEKLGFTVTWDKGVVTVTGQERYVRLTIGKDEYFAAPTQEGMMGASLFSLGCAPYVTNGRTYVPVELFNTLLGCKEGTITLEKNTVKISTDSGSMNTVQIPNPFTDHTTLSEATKTVGFELAVPEKVNGSPRQNIQTTEDGMIQVFYGGEDDSICIRKAPGSEDISGDYNSYSQVTAVDTNGINVTMKGENNLVYLAIWTSGGYTYSISARTGMSNSDMSALVQSIK